MNIPHSDSATIYIQIAAYRDPELRNTIRSILETATHPENLVFGIAWQHSPYERWDHLDEYIKDKRFRIIDIDYRDAKGPCWARHKLNNLWNGEKYTMQLDSHHRFLSGWDVAYIDMIESLRSEECKKPLLSSYLPHFNPSENFTPTKDVMPWIMWFDRFSDEGAIHFSALSIDQHAELEYPVPTRFISRHFIFADGEFCQEVQYDPTYYFHGEEINLSVRAYVAGYDLFAPHKTFAWHEYIREGKRKHWNDHSSWHVLDATSYAHNKEVLGIDDTKSEKTVKEMVRTLRDYEKYAGVEFKTRRVHKNTLDRKVPPAALDENSFVEDLLSYRKMLVAIPPQIVE